MSDGATTGVEVCLAGARVRLLAQRALWWPAERTLFVADVHLGKAETFRELGVPVPAGPTAETLARLGALVDGWRAERLVVLGDLLHARVAHGEAVLVPLRRWRQARAALEVVLVRGNHDARAGDPPAALGVRVVDDGHRHGPFAWCHDPGSLDPLAPAAADAPVGATGDGRTASDAAAPHRLAGHLHPAVRLHGRGGGSLRLPCFAVERHRTVLPAFGAFTGCATVRARPGVRLYPVAGDRVFELPEPAALAG